MLNNRYLFQGDLHVPRLHLLRSKGFLPRVIYDIGANGGQWSMHIREIFPNAEFYLFEANEYFRPYLEKTGMTFIFALLGDKNQPVTFFARDKTGDSIFREQTKFYSDSVCEKRELQMVKLTDIVKHHALPLPDLIKLDVQGAEKLIIQGGIDIVSHAEAIILECKILEYNKGAPFFYEVMTLMEGLGYTLSDLLECHYLPSGELNEIDCLFIKKDSKLIKRGILIE
jgi:FkbM family methyltransferase